MYAGRGARELEMFRAILAMPPTNCIYLLRFSGGISGVEDCYAVLIGTLLQRRLKTSEMQHVLKFEKVIVER